MSIHLSNPPSPTRADLEAARRPGRHRAAVALAVSVDSERHLLAEVRRAVKRAPGAHLLTHYEREAVGAQVLADLCERARRAAPTVAVLPVPRVVADDDDGAPVGLTVTRAYVEREARFLILSRTGARRSASSPRVGWIDALGQRRVSLDDAEPGADGATVAELLSAPDVTRALDPVDLTGADVDAIAERLAAILTVPRDADAPDGERRPLTSAERRRVVVYVTRRVTANRSDADAVALREALAARRVTDGRSRARDAVDQDASRGRALLARALDDDDDARRHIYRAAKLAELGGRREPEPATRCRTAPMGEPHGAPADVLRWMDTASRALAVTGALLARDPGARTLREARAVGLVLACLRRPAPVAPVAVDRWAMDDARRAVEAEAAKLGAYSPTGERARPVAVPDAEHGRAHGPLARVAVKPTRRGARDPLHGEPRPVLAPRPTPSPAPVTVRRVLSWMPDLAASRADRALVGCDLDARALERNPSPDARPDNAPDGADDAPSGAR